MPNLVIVLALATLALVPALGQAAPLAASIDIVNYRFEDATTSLPASVASGAAITWTDVSGVHTVTDQSGAFDSGPLFVGDTFTVSLPPGSYIYVCAFHPTMRGVLVVA